MDVCSILSLKCFEFCGLRVQVPYFAAVQRESVTWCDCLAASLFLQLHEEADGSDAALGQSSAP